MLGKEMSAAWAMLPSQKRRAWGELSPGKDCSRSEGEEGLILLCL